MLEIFDPIYKSIIDDIEIDRGDCDVLASVFETYLPQLELGAVIDLDEAATKAINEYYKTDFCSEKKIARLRLRIPMDDLPYKIHTNRELKLMLEGKKPLAAFCDAYLLGSPQIEFDIEKAFEKYVNDGLFINGEFHLNDEPNAVRWVLYALKSEAWRIDAFRLLKMTAQKSGWNEGFERMEGSLLGYEDWQSDIYIRDIFYRKKIS
jgi:hypothetical protein